jgi:hypothetical protein
MQYGWIIMPSGHGKIQFDHKGIGNVLVHSRLKVPLNQREYSWEESHVRDLFQDIAGALANDKTYFLGTIVLTQGADGVPEVTDGQQRLATTTILLAAIRDWFLQRQHMDFADSIESDFLRKFDREEQDVVPRLQLNVDDHEFLRKICPRSARNYGATKRQSLQRFAQAHSEGSHYSGRTRGRNCRPLQ